jgi:oligopeptide/dipeptide ABC transporter ATP-binding protein
MTTPLLELDRVRKDFKVGGGLLKRSITALEDVSLTLGEGSSSVHAIVGESGSGKSTLARLVMGLIKPTSGRVLYRGRDVQDWLRKDALTFRREVQMILQDPYSTYNPFYRVDRVLYSTVRKFKLASSRDEAHTMVVEAMRVMGMRPEYILGRFPHQLSGGERQRLMLCRILLIKPRIIVADEPVSMLDASLRAIFLDNMLGLKDELGLSCLYITHDMNVARHVSDTIMIMTHGAVAERGVARRVIERPLHPYSQLLVDSMPIPDPDRRWKEVMDFNLGTMEDIKPKQGCKFTPRCPHAMDVCAQAAPQLLPVEDRDVACYLYHDEPVPSEAAHMKRHEPADNRAR